MAVISGQKAVAAAGTAVTLVAATNRVNGPVQIKALGGNSGMIYVGNDGAGDVASTNGYELDAGDSVIFEYVGDLINIIIDAETNDDAVCWLALGSNM